MQSGWELFQKGGPVMYVLLLCSVAVAAIAIERYRFYRQAGTGAAGFVAELGTIVRGHAPQEAQEIVAMQQSAPAYIAGAVLETAAEGGDARLALDTAYGDMAMMLRRRLNYLSMIVTLAPLLGLLGTISGMIQSFSIFSIRAGEPLAITGGIGEALIATATGLCVAIFALIVHTYFAQRLDEMLNVLDKTSATLLAALEEKGGEAHAA